MRPVLSVVKGRGVVKGVWGACEGGGERVLVRNGERG